MLEATTCQISIAWATWVMAVGAVFAAGAAFYYALQTRNLLDSASKQTDLIAKQAKATLEMAANSTAPALVFFWGAVSKAEKPGQESWEFTAKNVGQGVALDLQITLKAYTGSSVREERPFNHQMLVRNLNPSARDKWETCAVETEFISGTDKVEAEIVCKDPLGREHRFMSTKETTMKGGE